MMYSRLSENSLARTLNPKPLSGRDSQPLGFYSTSSKVVINFDIVPLDILFHVYNGTLFSTVPHPYRHHRGPERFEPAF
jgi:hypothetical protein